MRKLHNAMVSLFLLQSCYALAMYVDNKGDNSNGGQASDEISVLCYKVKSDLQADHITPKYDKDGLFLTVIKNCLISSMQVYELIVDRQDNQITLKNVATHDKVHKAISLINIDTHSSGERVHAMDESYTTLVRNVEDIISAPVELFMHKQHKTLYVRCEDKAVIEVASIYEARKENEEWFLTLVSTKY